MSTIIDKRQRADQFRLRLNQAITDQGVNRSELARRTGVDRSTISQLLNDRSARLPNGHVAGALASVLGISTDWLLGLSDRPEQAVDLLSNNLTLTEAPRALVDERIFEWHQQAAGYKIRHVPAALPDMLKTRAVLEWEYVPHLGRTADQAIGASEDRLTWMRQAQSDYEIALPVFEFRSFAEATGYYEGLPAEIRREQLDQFISLADQLYPRLRIYLYDARRLYSAPVTIFGPLLCAIYTGGHYMAFRDRERVETFTRNFDRLVREAVLTAREVPEYLAHLRAGL
jgi:transcriptional regulator with XRE-family HTH domain